MQIEKEKIEEEEEEEEQKEEKQSSIYTPDPTRGSADLNGSAIPADPNIWKIWK